MMSEHTPEPWRAEEASIYRDAGQALVVDCGVVHRSKGERHANARRVVATINACAGIATEVLEANEEELVGYVAATQARAERAVALLRFMMDQLNELVNRHYGGELPCSEAEIKEFEQARAFLEEQP